MAEFVLKPTLNKTPVEKAARAKADSSLPEMILAQNVQWFCRLRWLTVAALLPLGLLVLFSNIRHDVSLGTGLISIALMLGLCNFGFQIHARHLRREEDWHGARFNLLTQMTLDMLVLTLLIYFTRTIDTYVPFAYLFHIVLACIFFSRPKSLMLTFLACGLYITSALLFRFLGWGDIVMGGSGEQDRITFSAFYALNLFSVPAIWLGVWYLTSRLSAMVRDRDKMLDATNQRLVTVQEERSRHMLRTTHELKAPFAAIHANTQLLLSNSCGQLPDQARAVVERIATRCHRLANEIQELLQLSNLRSTSQKDQTLSRIDLVDVINWAVVRIEPQTKKRRIKFDLDLHPASFTATEDHMKMMIGNIISNAVVYSHDGGRVRLRSGTESDGRPVVEIEDHGIGIPEDKLPKIFEEYYRTNEASQHNKESSGLGLAIVQHVAQTYDIAIRVISRQDKGTNFILQFPSNKGISNPGTEQSI